MIEGCGQPRWDDPDVLVCIHSSRIARYAGHVRPMSKAYKKLA